MFFSVPVKPENATTLRLYTVVSILHPLKRSVASQGQYQSAIMAAFWRTLLSAARSLISLGNYRSYIGLYDIQLDITRQNIGDCDNPRVHGEKLRAYGKRKVNLLMTGNAIWILCMDHT